ncbi:MFS transporter [Microbispora sp. GKU 823]|uniref:MFS transporter n=1 Tax=Microbispora sp. GKU 823 TaxID=1652100 RepID=UPI0009CAE5DF|nr:MFS transporter [Microbispora sp. GKU 823]OPG06995.1 MFS transporter [Microbispora sp. GKU 823]
MDTTAEGSAGSRAGRREWIGLAVLALATLLLSLDISVLYLALPELTADLGASASQQLWIMDIYSFMTAGFLVTMGGLGDRVGRRRLLLVGAAVFGVASLFAAFAQNPGTLIAARALIGVSAATLLPSALALLRTMFRDPHEMGRAMGIWFGCFMGGMAIGPLIGGLLLHSFWWGSVFLLGVPVMVVVLVAGPLLLPEHHSPGTGRLDLTSVALSLGAILLFTYGVKELARSGWGAVPAVAVLAGVVVGVLFARRQRGLAEPLLDLLLFRDRRFGVSLSIMLISGIVMAGITLLSSMHLQMVAGLQPFTAGLWLLPFNLAMVAGSIVAPMLTRRFPIVYVMAAGLLLSAAGLLVITQVGTSGEPYVLACGLVLTSGGLALPMTLSGNLIMGSAPPEKAGSAAGIMETSGELGVALGVAIMGSLGAFVYRLRLPDDLPGLPGGSAGAAREGIAAAVVEAGRLPGQAAAELLAAARSAFDAGLTRSPPPAP